LDASDKKTWELILSYLKTQFPGNAKETLYPIGKVYFNIMNNYTDPKSGKTGAEYVSPEYIKWWKQKALDVQSGISTSAGATITKTLQQYRHEIAMAAAIATAFIPVIGPVLSAVISLADAKAYYDEGDKYTAGLITVLSLIPGGRVVAKSLARKIITKSGVLTTAEKSVLAKLAANKTLAKDQMAKLLQTAVETGKVTDAALKTMTQFVKPVSKGVYRVIGTGINIVTPMIAYDAAWNAANPNVTESEMLAILDEEEAILARDVNAMLDRAMRDHVHIGIGNILSEADSGIRSSKFTPPDETDTGASDTDSGGGGLPFWIVIGGTIVSALGGSAVFKSLLNNKFGIGYLEKAYTSFKKLRGTKAFNAKLSDLQVKGLTRNKYKSIVVELRKDVRKNLENVLMRFERGGYDTVDDAVNDFIKNAPFNNPENRKLVDKKELKKIFNEIIVLPDFKYTANQISNRVQQNKLIQSADKFYKELSAAKPMPKPGAGLDTAAKRQADKQALQQVQNQRIELARNAGHLTRPLSQSESDVIRALIRKSSQTPLSVGDLYNMFSKYKEPFLKWRAANPELPISNFKIP
jgi:hypothetical protein